jgi:hypothetical protein
MSMKAQAQSLPASRGMNVPAWLALAVAVAALVVSLISLGSDEAPSRGSSIERSSIGSSVTAPFSYGSLDRAALEAAGFTGRLGGVTSPAVQNVWSGVDTAALAEAGFSGRLGGASVSPDWTRQAIRAGYTGRLGGSTASSDWVNTAHEAGFTGRLGG